MKQRIFLIINLSVVSALVMLGFSVISPVLPQYALSFSVSVAMTGWAVSSFALARLFVDIPAGILADHFGRKRNMFLGLVLIVVSSVVSGMATTYGWLILGRIVQGMGSALYMTTAIAWVAETSAGESRGRFMSLYTTFVFAGTSFGPAIGGYSAAHLGLNGPFFVYGGLTALGLLATIPLKETTRPASTGPRISLGDVKDLLTSSSFLLINSAVLALFFIRAGVRSTLIPLYASLNLGLNAEEIGLLMTVSAVVSSLVTFPSGWLSDRVGRKIPIMSCLFLSAIAVVLIPFQMNMSTFVAVMAFYGLAAGLQGSIAAWPADVAPKDRLGTAMGVYRVIGDFGLVLGPITVTYVAGNTGNLAVPLLPFIIPSILALVVGIGLVWAKDPAAKRKATTILDSAVQT